MSYDEALIKREVIARCWWDSLTARRRVELFEREVPDGERRKFAVPSGYPFSGFYVDKEGRITPAEPGRALKRVRDGMAGKLRAAAITPAELGKPRPRPMPEGCETTAEHAVVAAEHGKSLARRVFEKPQENVKSVKVTYEVDLGAESHVA